MEFQGHPIDGASVSALVVRDEKSSVGKHTQVFERVFGREKSWVTKTALYDFCFFPGWFPPPPCTPCRELWEDLKPWTDLSAEEPRPRRDRLRSRWLAVWLPTGRYRMAGPIIAVANIRRKPPWIVHGTWKGTAPCVCVQNKRSDDTFSRWIGVYSFPLKGVLLAPSRLCGFTPPPE